jgi:beta-glucanase (GH16 family)
VRTIIQPASRRLLSLTLVTAVALTGIITGIVADSGSVQWRTAWAADFGGPAGSGVGPQSWTYDTGGGGFGNGEVETMTDGKSNVYLDGHGSLNIAAVYQDSAWTSGRIVTTRTFGAPASGEMMVSASIKQPGPPNGVGYWPAFWLLGPSPWPEGGEIDVMEDVNGLSRNAGTFHCGNLVDRNPGGSLGPCHEYTGLSSGLRPCPGCQQEYHAYSVIVDRRNTADQQIRWYLDSREYFSVSESQVGTAAWVAAVDHGFNIILDLAIGGAYPDAECHCTAPSPKTTSGAAMSVRSLMVSYADG